MAMGTFNPRRSSSAAIESRISCFRTSGSMLCAEELLMMDWVTVSRICARMILSTKPPILAIRMVRYTPMITVTNSVNRRTTTKRETRRKVFSWVAFLTTDFSGTGGDTTAMATSQIRRMHRGRCWLPLCISRMAILWNCYKIKRREGRDGNRERCHGYFESGRAIWQFGCFLRAQGYLILPVAYCGRVANGHYGASCIVQNVFCLRDIRLGIGLILERDRDIEDRFFSTLYLCWSIEQGRSPLWLTELRPAIREIGEFAEVLQDGSLLGSKDLIQVIWTRSDPEVTVILVPLLQIGITPVSLFLGNVLAQGRLERYVGFRCGLVEILVEDLEAGSAHPTGLFDLTGICLIG